MSVNDGSPDTPSPQPTPAPLANLERGYEHFLDDRAAVVSVDWDQTLAVLDTNVLLNLYRSPDQARAELIGALEGIAGSLFMPAQVQREFWRNRDGVLRENAAMDEVAGELRRMLQGSRTSLTNLGKGKIGAPAAQSLIDRVEATLKAVIKEAASHRTSFDWRAALSAASRDTVLRTLLALYKGKVGPEYTEDEFAAGVAEAADRFARRVPPGYEDAGKNVHLEEGAGDYLLWRQTIAQARVTQKDVILVTQDTKEDWWRRDAGKTPINARFELVEEMRRFAGVGFRLLQTADFIRILAETTGSPVSERTVQQVDELALAGEAVEPPVDNAASWTAPMFEALLVRLVENDYEDRALVLRTALLAPNGSLSRAEVLLILGREPEAKLTGFTRAISSATKQLIDEGLLSPVADAALWAEYDGPGKAVSFSTPLTRPQGAAHPQSEDEEV